MALTRPRYSQIYDTDYKQSVRVATTEDVGNLLASGNMTNTVDGKLLATADRILVKDQSDAKQNGIYKVLTVGTGSDGTWIRASDADANGLGKVTSGMTTTVTEGDVNISKTYKLSTPDPITIGVTELTFINPFASSAVGGDKQIPFNDSGTNNATANLTFNKTNNTLTVSNAIVITQLIGNANVAVSGSLLPSANVTYDLGSPTQRWREGWFSGSTIHIGDESISVDGNGKWTFTSDGAAVELGKNNDFNPPNANISGNVTATNYLFANGTPLMTVVNTMISVANTAMKGYADGEMATLTSNAAVQAGDIATLYANAGAQSGALVAANTAMKGYVDGEISTTTSAITTANTAMKGYVDGQITNLVNGAPLTLDTLNELATALGNDANLSVTITNQIANVNSNITTANSAMKGYVDGQISTVNSGWQANAGTQAGDIATLFSNAAVQAGIIASLTNYSNANVTSYLPTHTGNIGAASINATNLYGTVRTAAQTSITSVGTLDSLTVTGNVSAGNLSATNLTGTIRTAAQPSITSLGTLSGLSIDGNITFTGTGRRFIADMSAATQSDRFAFQTSTLNNNTNILGIPNGTSVQTTWQAFGNSDPNNAHRIFFGTVNSTDTRIVSDATGTANVRPMVFIVGAKESLRIGTVGNVVVPGNITVNSDNNTVAIINGGTAGVGNIGASGAGFNTVFAKATSAQYADLAEVYRSDRNYIPGTVVVFGGTSEVTVSLISHDPAVAGVVSTNPAYLMNDTVEGSAVALQGRVPCRVLGPITRGDRVVTSDVRGVAERLDMTKYQPGCIIGKALGSIPDGEIATIEVVVGRN